MSLMKFDYNSVRTESNNFISVKEKRLVGLNKIEKQIPRLIG